MDHCINSDPGFGVQCERAHRSSLPLRNQTHVLLFIPIIRVQIIYLPYCERSKRKLNQCPNFGSRNVGTYKCTSPKAHLLQRILFILQSTTIIYNAQVPSFCAGIIYALNNLHQSPCSGIRKPLFIPSSTDITCSSKLWLQIFRTFCSFLRLFHCLS